MKFGPLGLKVMTKRVERFGVFWKITPFEIIFLKVLSFSKKNSKLFNSFGPSF